MVVNIHHTTNPRTRVHLTSPTTPHHTTPTQTDDPAVLFAVVLMALRLASPTPFPPPTGPDQRDRAGADVLGWEGWGWEAPSAGNGSSMAIPNTLEGLCALPAAALREGGGGYAGWYRRVVLGACTALGRGSALVSAVVDHTH